MTSPTDRCFAEIRRRSQAMADAMRHHPSAQPAALVIELPRRTVAQDQPDPEPFPPAA
jgi:hypothetical protein